MTGRGAGMLLIARFEARDVAALLTTKAEQDLILRSALCARLEG